MKQTLILAAAILLAACSSAPRVEYGDPADRETLTIDFGSTDLQTMAADMASSMATGHLAARTEKPVIFFGGVENATAEHIDMMSISNAVRTRIFKSGVALVTADDAALAEIQDQLDWQQSGWVDAATAKEIGRLVGADMVLTGRLVSIDKRAGRDRNLYYNFTMSLWDIQQGLLVWTEEKEIRKTSKKPLLGF